MPRRSGRTPLAVEWAKARPAIRNRTRWILLARTPQLPPDGDWNVWLYMAGRGAGKTRSAAEDMAYWGLTHPGARMAVIAPTYGAVRDVCIEGETGILACLDPEDVEGWNRSMGELALTNGTRYKCFSGDEPDRLRGPQHHRAWCDELAAFRYPETWDMLLMGLRLGERPRCIVTTTPKPTKLMRDLITRKDVALTHESTFANEANLSSAALATFRERYGGTRLGAQELEGKLLEDVEGALWTAGMIEDHRLAEDPDRIGHRVIVTIDPAGTVEGDETGIIAAATDHTNVGYVLADRSGNYTSVGWAEAAIELYRELRADRIVAERNNGGEMVEAVLRQVDPNIPYTSVWASKGKQPRAEPVAALYEQGRIHHVGVFPELEAEMTSWVPGEQSPNRMDALVWAFHDLILEATAPTMFGRDVMENRDALLPSTPTVTGDLLERQF